MVAAGNYRNRLHLCLVNDSGSVPADVSQELRKLKSQDMPAVSQPRLVAPELSVARKKQGDAAANSDEASFLEPARTSVTPSDFSSRTADVVIESFLLQVHLKLHVSNLREDVQLVSLESDAYSESRTK